MNLKDSFRYQNQLNKWIDNCLTVIGDRSNYLNRTSILFHSKISSDLKNEIRVEEHSSPYASRINDIVDLCLFLLHEKEKLSAQVRRAKIYSITDIDTETSLNQHRQNVARILKILSVARNEQKILRDAGKGTRFNAEGNQTVYTCDMEIDLDLNFDKNRIRSSLDKLLTRINDTSTKIDQTIINQTVDYEPVFNVESQFDDIVEAFFSMLDNQTNIENPDPQET